MNAPHNFRLLYGSRKPLPEEILQESRSQDFAANYHFTACIFIFVFSHPFIVSRKQRKLQSTRRRMVSHQRRKLHPGLLMDCQILEMKRCKHSLLHVSEAKINSRWPHGGCPSQQGDLWSSSAGGWRGAREVDVATFSEREESHFSTRSASRCVDKSLSIDFRQPQKRELWEFMWCHVRFSCRLLLERDDAICDRRACTYVCLCAF